MKPQPNAVDDSQSHFGSSSVGPVGRSGRLSNGLHAPVEPLCLISKALGLLHTIACSARVASMASNPQEISSGEDDTNLTHSAGLAIGRQFPRAKARSKAKNSLAKLARVSKKWVSFGKVLYLDVLEYNGKKK